MANDNALAAVLSGVKAGSVTIIGLGERAVNTPPEDLVMALKISMGYELDLDQHHITPLSACVEKA